MLTGLIGNGLAVLVAGIAWIIARHRHHVPGRSSVIDEVLLTIAIVGMIFAGDLGTATGLGQWATSVIRGAEHLAGPVGNVIAALVTLLVLVRTAIAVLRSGASERAMLLAFALPFLLALFPSGFFHNLSGDLAVPAHALAVKLAAAIGA
jgi:hypothetical protein